MKVTDSLGEVMELFEAIKFYLECLNIHSGVPVERELQPLIVQTFAEILSILAHATEKMCRPLAGR